MRNDPLKNAVDAMCDLNAAYSIIAICEGGIFRTPMGNRFANRIVDLCKEHAGKQLRAYDRAKEQNNG